VLKKHPISPMIAVAVMVWTNNQTGWKPVSVSTSSTLRAARRAAREGDTLRSLPKSGRGTGTVIGLQAILAGAAGQAYQPSPEAADKAD